MPRRHATPAIQNDEDGDDFDELMDDGPVKDEGKGRRSRAAAGASLSSSEIDRKAFDLVRLALFTEYRRLPLKREDINKKVMGGNSKAFPQVFEVANTQLRKQFGYEMVELSSRAEREKNMMGVSTERDDEPKKKGTKQYIVRNILDPELIKFACSPDEEIRAQEEVDAPWLDENIQFTGSIIAWDQRDQVESYGILFVILSLILVNGKTIADATLRSQLKKLNLTPTSHINAGVMNAPKDLTIDSYLQLLIKQGYLDRVKVGNTTGQKGGKRSRVGAARHDDEEGSVDYEWRWGERSHFEISEQGVSDFIVSFMTERSKPDNNAQESARAMEERLKKVKKRYIKDVLRAAQTPLSKIEDQKDG